MLNTRTSKRTENMKNKAENKSLFFFFLSSTSSFQKLLRINTNGDAKSPNTIANAKNKMTTNQISKYMSISIID